MNTILYTFAWNALLRKSPRDCLNTQILFYQDKESHYKDKKHSKSANLRSV